MNPQDQRSDPQTTVRMDNRSEAVAGKGDLSTEVDLLGDDSAELSSEEYEKLLGMYDDTLRDLSEGQVVKGRIVKILANEVVVDVGYKSEGMISLDEFSKRDG